MARQSKQAPLTSTWSAWLRQNKNIPEVRMVLLFDTGKHAHCVKQLDVWEKAKLRTAETLARYREALAYVQRLYTEAQSASAGFRRAEDMVPVNDCGGFMRQEHVYGDDWNEVGV